MKKVLIILLLLSCAPHSISTQNDVSESVLEELTEDIDYSKQKWTLTPRHEAQPEEPIANETSSIGVLGEIMTYVIAVLVIMAIIIGALYVMFSSSSGDNPSIEGQQIEEFDLDPDHIDNIDPLSMIDEAISIGDYRLALRLRFIDFIKRCSDLRLIKWRPEKTNQEYLQELKPYVDFTYLRTVILEYEKVWFGKYDINSEDYSLYAAQYDTLISQINAAHE